MSVRTFGPFETDEACDLVVRTPEGSPVVDEDGELIPGSDVDSLHMTLYDRHTDTVIAERANVLNTAKVSWTPSGQIIARFDEEDNEIVTVTRAWETHVALFEYAYDDESRHGKFEVLLNVRNLHRVPTP